MECEFQNDRDNKYYYSVTTFIECGLKLTDAHIHKNILDSGELGLTLKWFGLNKDFLRLLIRFKKNIQEKQAKRGIMEICCYT